MRKEKSARVPASPAAMVECSGGSLTRVFIFPTCSSLVLELCADAIQQLVQAGTAALGRWRETTVLVVHGHGDGDEWMVGSMAGCEYVNRGWLSLSAVPSCSML